MKTKHFKSKAQGMWYIVHDTWELCNKPRRFFNSLRKCVEQFHEDSGEMMNALALSGSLKETLEQIDKLEEAYQDYFNSQHP